LANEITLVKAQIGEGRKLYGDQEKPFKYNKTNKISLGKFQTSNENLKISVFEFQLSTSFLINCGCFIDSE
jgi:hypothetical protein